MKSTADCPAETGTALAARPQGRTANRCRQRELQHAPPGPPRPGGLPASPKTLEETGLPRSFVIDLIIKHLYRYGALLGSEIAEHIRLPFTLIDALLDEIVLNTYAEKRGGAGLGNSADRFALTERGRNYARDLLALDTYTGPAPVPLDQYTEYIRSEKVSRIRVTQERLREAWKDFILDEELFALLGPAISSGKSCFLYGPPGTGKTTIAKAVASFLDKYGGGAAIPHALIVGGSIIRIFDQVYHHPISRNRRNSDGTPWLSGDQGDRRWVLCHRPVVIVGGELTLDMLDLRYNTTSRYYEAPLQVKANCGILVIDDFGRQLVRPKDLLNRWIVPLEEKIDFLTLHTGKKFPIPFEELVIFATNLDPMDLADEAFLRRIRYKIFIGEPSVGAYKAIFDQECKNKGLSYDPHVLDQLLQKHYVSKDRLRRACDPRDLTDQIYDYCVFNNLPFDISFDILDRIACEYFAKLKGR